MANYWLKCKVSQGQFSDELAISGRDYEGQGFSFFTSKTFVKSPRNSSISAQEVDACLSVVPLDSRDGLVLIALPSKTFGNGNTITVREGDLTTQMECELQR